MPRGGPSTVSRPVVMDIWSYSLLLSSIEGSVVPAHHIPLCPQRPKEQPTVILVDTSKRTEDDGTEPTDSKPTDTLGTR